MPIYEYQCTDCKHQMEAIQKVSDDPLVECPACGKQNLKKLVSAASFHLKGTGWYETDFKGKPKAKDDTKQDTKKEDTATKSDAGKSEEKKSKDDSVKSKKAGTTSTASS